MNLKSLKKDFYALKIFNKWSNVKKINNIKKVGLFGKDCRFIVETIATFHSNVNITELCFVMILCSYIILNVFKF